MGVGLVQVNWTRWETDENVARLWSLLPAIDGQCVEFANKYLIATNFQMGPSRVLADFPRVGLFVLFRIGAEQLLPCFFECKI